MPVVIINADDFGLSSEINHAIDVAFRRGLISSTTIMANMPGFGEACELVRRRCLHGKVGLHLNMTYGTPLSPMVSQYMRLCDAKGHFRPPRRLLWLSRQEAKTLETEFEAQLAACINNGIHPSHLDSHHHMHTKPAVLPIVIRIARRHGIPAVRLAANCGAATHNAHHPRTMVASMYHAAHNLCLRACRLAKSQHFGSAREIGSLRRRDDAVFEMGVHLRIASGEIIDLDGSSSTKLSDLLKELSISPHRLLSYSDVCHSMTVSSHSAKSSATMQQE